MAVTREHVNVDARIDRAVTIPADIHATLQQATVLGDIYVSLDRPADQARGPLCRGGRIMLDNTQSPPQLEDTIATMANFVSSGSIQRLQNTIIGLNRRTPSGQHHRLPP